MIRDRDDLDVELDASVEELLDVGALVQPVPVAPKLLGVACRVHLERAAVELRALWERASFSKRRIRLGHRSYFPSSGATNVNCLASPSRVMLSAMASWGMSR